jgi:thiol-disulfide isomerase/thioredoxin
LTSELLSEGQPVRALASLCVIACCLGLAGCSLFGRKTASKPNQAPRPGGEVGWPPAEAPAAAIADRPAPAASSGILAGRVIDSYDRNPPPAYIQVVAAQDAGAPKGAPVEVATDAQGYFAIHDLKPGQSYQLIARTKDGQPKLAGSTWAKPPNPRVLIQLSADFVTPNTPPPPNAPTLPGQKGSPSTAISPPTFPERPTGQANSSGGDASRPLGTFGPRGVEIGPPVRIQEPSESQPRSEIRPQDIVAEPNGFARRDPPVSIPSPSPQELLPGQEAPYASIPPSRVPSCVLTGKQLHNFALYDVSGPVWEFKSHRGKLVLLDFWGTWCIPCLQATHHLRILQENYGRDGLEVIGIDYEREGSTQEQIRRVQGIRDRLGLNYRLLLGGDMLTCPVKTQFGIRAFPTLILLDENNRIIWREEGLDEVKLQDLTTLIKYRLHGGP